MMLTVLLVVALAAILYYLVARKHNYWKDRGVGQGKPVWLVGHFLKVFLRRESHADLVQTLYHQSPGKRYTGMYSFSFPILVINDPELLKQINVKDFDHFTDHLPFLPEDCDPLCNKNLITLKGNKWREMRAILSPAFTSSKMKTMFVLMAECVDDLMQYLLKKEEDIITIEMKDITTRFANDVIATTAFGVHVDSLSDPNNEFYLMGKKVVDVSGLWKTLKFILCHMIPEVKKILKVQLFSDEVSYFFSKLIDETIKEREENGIVRPDMINLLMEARKGSQKPEENGVIDTGFAVAQEYSAAKEKVPKELTNQDITAQALLFFFAGFDSVSGLMCFLAYELALNPNIQDRLRKDIQSTWAECNGKLTYEALLKMKYLDMVVSETLRKWPNVAALDRISTKPYVIEPATPDEKPLYIEKGTALWLPLFAIHRDPKYFADPERFDPERFNDENKGNIKSGTYFPFGLGPRNCIGSRFALMEAKLVFFHILLRFEIIPVEKTPIPFVLSRKSFALTARDGFWLGLKRFK